MLVEAYGDDGCNHFLVFIGDYTPDFGYPFSIDPSQYLDLATSFAEEVLHSFM